MRTQREYAIAKYHARLTPSGNISLRCRDGKLLFTYDMLYLLQCFALGPLFTAFSGDSRAAHLKNIAGDLSRNN
jgi:hypothetical protein